IEIKTKKRYTEAIENIEKNLQQENVEVRTILGEARININEFLNLKSQDIIMLNQSIEEPLQLTVNKEPKFYVQAGRSKSRLSVQVIEEIKGGNKHDG